MLCRVVVLSVLLLPGLLLLLQPVLLLVLQGLSAGHKLGHHHSPTAVQTKLPQACLLLATQPVLMGTCRMPVGAQVRWPCCCAEAVGVPGAR